MHRRLDAELVRRGLAASRAQARELVDAGRVLVGGAPAGKPSRLVGAGDPLLVEAPPPRFVGRGGEKLAAALERFGLDPAGLHVLDAGASTGGFTDCLLQAGAASVVALDVGHGQLHERLRSDPRVRVLERTNLRHIDPAVLGEHDVVVADLSFISPRTVMPTLVACSRRGGWLVLLVKPQFEVGRIEAARGRGVITDSGLWRSALHGVLDAAVAAGAVPRGLMPSPLRGAAGNVEFLLWLRRNDPKRGGGIGVGPLIDDAVAAAADSGR